MKQLTLLIGISILLSGNLFAQDIIQNPEFSGEKIMGDVIHVEGDLLYYYYQESSYRSLLTEQIHTIINFKTGKIIANKQDGIRYERLGGYVLDHFVQGGFIYELVRFIKSTQANKCQIGIIKRNLSDSKQAGDIHWLGEFTFRFDQNVSLLKSESCFYLISTNLEVKTNNVYLKKYDFQLNQLWQNDLSYLNEEGVEVTSSQVDEVGNVTIVVSLSKPTKKWSFNPVRSYGLGTINVQADGQEYIATLDLNEDITIESSKFKYLPNTEELVGFFIITQVENKIVAKKEGVGYAYYKWNKEGTVSEYKRHQFSLEDLNTNNTFINFTENINLIGSVAYDNGDLIGIIQSYVLGVKLDVTIDIGNENTVFVLDYFGLRTNRSGLQTRTFLNSKLVFSVNRGGEIEWLHFFPYSLKLKPNRAVTRFNKNDIELYTTEYLENFVEGEFELNLTNEVAYWKNTIPASRRINRVTGEIISFKPINKTIDKLKLIDKIDLQEYQKENKILFMYSNGKKNHTTVEYVSKIQ
jgi:hypothetical protein